MVKDISVEEALSRPGILMVDVRSESEFEEATIPGAVNIPFLNNEERASVGTVYKQVSPQAARRLGLELVSPRLPEFINHFEKLAGKRDIVLFCWRGGQRSQFVSYMLDMMGFNVYRVQGGYKAYRRYINQYLEGKLTHRAVVLHGLTGVGKTEVLTKLGQAGIPTLDLEGLARHRGSVYGKVGLPPSPTQKMFESMIVQALNLAESKGIFVVECESRRLGNLLVPQTVMNTMKEGYRVLLYDSIKNRIHRTIAEYIGGGAENVEALQNATTALVKYLGAAKVRQLNELLGRGDFEQAIKYLLIKYYDPLYKYPDKPDDDYHLCVDTSDINNAVEQIQLFISGLPEFKNSVIKGGEAGGHRQYPERSQGKTGAFAGGG